MDQIKALSSQTLFEDGLNCDHVDSDDMLDDLMDDLESTVHDEMIAEDLSLGEAKSRFERKVIAMKSRWSNGYYFK